MATIGYSSEAFSDSLLGRTFFGRLISSLRILVVIGITERPCNVLFLSHLRLVILFRAYPEHTPSRPEGRQAIVLQHLPRLPQDLTSPWTKVSQATLTTIATWRH